MNSGFFRLSWTTKYMEMSTKGIKPNKTQKNKGNKNNQTTTTSAKAITTATKKRMFGQKLCDKSKDVFENYPM